jgi:DNA-binding transcriptional LysR family regulator
MNTLFFKYALEVEKTRSISQAAENLFMTQPTLSKAIKEMETQIGYPIFERSSKGVMPTPQGREFLIHAENISAELERIQSLSSSQDSSIPHFKLSIPRSSYIAHGFTNFVADLCPSQGLDIQVQETNSIETIHQVANGQCNLGIIRYQQTYEPYFLDFLQDKNFSWETIWEFKYLLLFSENHPLAGEEIITPEQLTTYTEIVHRDNAVPYLKDSEAGGRMAKAVPNKIYLYERCNQFELLSRIPTTYMWVSPIPTEMLQRYPLTQRSCQAANIRCKDVLIYPNGYTFSHLDKQFIARLYEAKNQVAFQNYT